MRHTEFQLHELYLAVIIQSVFITTVELLLRRMNTPTRNIDAPALEQVDTGA